jgi:hypothetical protein
MQTLPKDVFNWDEHQSHVDMLDELNRLEKDEARRAFDYLKRTLGEDFLRRIQATGKYHPLMGYVINFAPWTRKYLTRLAASIRALETSPNIANVLRQLEEADRFLHNVLLIEATAKLVLEGFRAAFEPTLPPANFQKQPDAKLVSPETQEEIFLEVSILGRARESIEAFEAMNAVTITFMKMPAGVRWAGRLYKIPAPSHLTDIVSRIEKALQRVVQEQCFTTVSEEGTIDVAVCPESQMELLEDWCSKHALQPGSFEGPPDYGNAIARLRRKIETEQKQLPTAFSNVILIDHTDLFFNVRDIRAAINELEEEVYCYPHVVAVIISGSHISAPENRPEIVQKGEHRYTRRTLDMLYVEDSLLLFNRYSPAKLSTSVLSKLLRAF